VLEDVNLQLPELRVAEVARTPEGMEFLQRKLAEEYFVRLAAEGATVSPHHGKRLSTWLARHFPMLATGSDKGVRKFLVDAKLMGETLADTFEVTGAGVSGNVARVHVAQLFSDSYKRVEKVFQAEGVRLSRDELNRLWIDAVELGRTPVLLRQLSEGTLTPRQQAYLGKLHQRFIDKLGSLGMGEETRKLLLREAEDINHAFEDLHGIADLAGLDIGDVTTTGVGYMPRMFSEDFQFRMGRLDPEVANAFASGNTVGAVGSSLRKSRTTYDLLVEDELMLASALGLVDEKQVKALQKITQHGPDMAGKTRSELLAKLDDELEGMTTRHSMARELVETQTQRAMAEAEAAYTQARTLAPLKKNPKKFLEEQRARVDKVIGKQDKRLQKLLSDHAKAEQAYWTKRGEQLGGLDEFGGAVQAQAALEELMVDSTHKLAGLMNEDGVLVEQLLKLDPDKLDKLIDSGILSKVPIPTTQLADELIKRYDLPYSGIDELLITDPHQAYQHAKEQTKRAMGRSVVLRGFYRDALDNGWGVTEAELFANPELYKGWHKLDPDLLLERFGLSKELNPPTPMYVHPAVEEQLIGVLSVSTDPMTQGTFARVWQYTWKLAKEQVLTTSGFLGRQTWQLFIQAGMSGTNLAHIMPSIAQWAKFGGMGLDAFDNTAKRYAGGTLTQREMVKQAMERGFLDTHQAVGVGQASVKSTESGASLNPFMMAKALNKWGSIGKQFGVLPDKGGWAFVEYGAGLVGRASNDAAAHVMGWGVWLEQAYKLAYLETVMSKPGLNQLGQFMVGSKARAYDNMDDALRNARDYFLDYSDYGEGDRWVSKNIAPFWMYMSRSVPATMRHVLRNPQQYVTYQRLYHLATQDVRENPRENPEGGVAPWQQNESGTIYLPHPDGDGRLIHIPLASVDPVADVSNRLNGIADALGSALGLYGPDGARGYVSEAKEGGATSRVLTAMLGQSFGPAKSLLGLLTREDPRTGKSLVLRAGAPTPTVLGLEVPGGELSPLAKFMLENTLPSVANLNRWNPGGVFGRKEREDANGDVVLPGSPGWAGNERTDADANYAPDLPPVWQVLKATGITVNSVDLALGMQYSTGDMSKAAREVKTRYGVLLKTIEDPNTSPTLRARSEQQAIALAALYVELETGKVAGTQWLNAEGYLSKEQRDKAVKAAERKLESAAKKQATHTHKVRTLTESLQPTPPTQPPQP
jgi:hypothetical protein